MLRYQGVDWRDPNNWACNDGCAWRFGGGGGLAWGMERDVVVHVCSRRGCRGSQPCAAHDVRGLCPCVALAHAWPSSLIPLSSLAPNPRINPSTPSLNPYSEYMYDGINLSPFEVMFVKIKDYLLDANWTNAEMAQKYTGWMESRAATGAAGVVSNEYTGKRDALRRAKIAGMRERGPACFDFDYYKLRNPDLPVPPWTASHLWEHFVMYGQHEGRVFR